MVGLPPLVNHDIHFLKSLCMAAALDNVANCARGAKVVIYTDNEVSYFSFNSLHSLPDYNPILLFSAGVQMDFDICVCFSGQRENQIMWPTLCRTISLTLQRRSHQAYPSPPSHRHMMPGQWPHAIRPFSD